MIDPFWIRWMAAATIIALVVIIAGGIEEAFRVGDVARFLGWLQRRAAPASADEIAELQKRIQEGACMHCGGLHAHACWRVKTIEFRSDGMTPAKIEFWEKWDTTDTLFPTEVFALQSKEGSTDGTEQPA